MPSAVQAMRERLAALLAEVENSAGLVLGGVGVGSAPRCFFLQATAARSCRPRRSSERGRKPKS